MWDIAVSFIGVGFLLLRLMSRTIKFPALLLIVSSFSLSTNIFAQDVRINDDTSNAIGEGSVIAFVGRKISFTEDKTPPVAEPIKMPNGTVVMRTIPRLDSKYNATYQVIKWIHGEPKAETVNFNVYDHYSRPALPNIENPLVLLVRYEGGWAQSKYNNYSLYRTTDGDWGICGVPARFKSMKDQGERYVQPLSFIETIKSENGDICKAGTRVKDIFEYNNKTKFLPESRRITCNRELEIPSYFNAGTGSSADAPTIANAHAACIERLEFEALSK